MKHPPPLLRYGLVPLAVAAAMLLRWPLWSVLQGELAFLFLWPVVIFCAWWGGLGPGLLATALSALSAAFFLLPPRLSLAVAAPADLVGVSVFVAVGVAISVLSGRMHRGHRLAERRAGEVARQREWLRVSLESIGDAVIATDTQGRVSLLNPTACSLAGWSPEDAQGQPLETVFRIIDERTRQPVEDPVARVLREGVVVGLANHTVLVARDGTERAIEDSAAPIKDGEGNILGVILVFHDVTEKRRQALALEQRTAELALAKSHLEAVFHSVGEGITAFDPQANIVFCNDAEARIAGFDSPQEMMRNLSYFAEGFELTDADGRIVPVDRWPVSRVLRGESFTDWECHGRRKDTGQEWEFSFSGSPVWDEGGRQVLSVVVTRDITNRKHLESQLRQRVEALKEADRRKDQFLAMLAHELRNPLAPVRNALHILKSPRADREAVEKARAMTERQVVHLARIVDDLLDVSRITRGKIELRVERLDLARLVRVTVEDHHAPVAGAGLSIRVEVPEVPLWVQGDPTRLTQVVANLLQNAVKFTPRGGSVSVHLTADVGRGQAVLAIRDSGTGIEPEILPRLFEPFAQADRSLDRSKGGLGLGLALVKGLAELHGGEVQAASDGPGRGAEFVVRLPTEPEPAAITGMPEAPSSDGKRLRILVVEDNRDAADSLRLLLELYGYVVEVAYTGPSGVEAAKQWKPDVVVCDIGLPGLDGYGVVRELRRHPATAQVRMIAVTGYGGDQDRERSQEAGFDAHLTKPADPTALQELLAGSGANN